MMKRMALVAAVAAVMVCLLAGVAFGASTARMDVDGQELQMKNGKVVAPVRTIAEALGFRVEWDKQSNSILITSSHPGKNRSNEINYPELFGYRNFKLSKALTPEEVLLTYFNALYHACNLPEDNKVPISGTIGSLKEPYPEAYSCWSRDWREKTGFEDFLNSWEGTVNVELLKLIPAGEENGEKKFFVETRNMEAIQDSDNPRMGVFCYKGYASVANTEEGWRISSMELTPEDPSWYIAGHQPWYSDAVAVAQVIGMEAGMGAETGSNEVEYNQDGSVTVRFKDKNGADTHRIVLVQTQDHIYQVISKEEVGQEEPVSQPIIIRTEKEVFENEEIKITLQYPRIEGLEDKALKDNLNRVLKDKAVAARNQGLKNAEEMKKLKESGYGSPHKCETYFDYAVKYNQKGLLSIVLSDYQYSGGAHGLTVQSSLTFDLETGKEYQLKDIFAQGTDYVSLISDEVKKMIQKQGAAEALLNPFEAIREDQDFYLTKDGLVVYFQVYEYFPYVSGIPEFTIGYPILQDNFSTEFEILK